MLDVLRHCCPLVNIANIWINRDMKTRLFLFICKLGYEKAGEVDDFTVVTYQNEGR